MNVARPTRLAIRTFAHASIAWMAMSLPSAAVAQRVAALANGAVLEYSVRNADTLYDLAAQYLATPTDWVSLQQLNHVRDPKRLQPGRSLLIPVALLRNAQPTARVIAVTGQAESFGRYAGSASPLRVGTVLAEGDHIRTGARSFATIELSDGSHVALLPGTTVWIKRLRELGADHAVNRQFEVDAGEVETRVSPLKPQDNYDVVTPSIVAGVRGTVFRASYAADTRRSMVEVLEGKVRVARGSSPDGADGTLVPHGSGIAATDDRLGDAAELLPAPALSQPAQVQSGERLSFEVVALPHAKRYRATIATDAGFLDIVDDALSTETKITLAGRAPGVYFVRVSALDANGIEGLSRIYSFTRTGPASADSVPANFEFRWTDQADVVAHAGWHFMLAADDHFDSPIVDQSGLAGNRLVLSNLPEGQYYWSINAESTPRDGSAPRRSVIQSFSIGR
ncbi:FecR domain-containing protein [Burkholderia sp. BE17]|uniref:FecR domain-containing protein n=1 Tax=Burkholderia sp. BE17 TaxID=2656644 RepID=UPI00128C9A11|nr:FecR domain-containing protein [Burkholderia sp. BE17]MPV68639.1 LysM peptidoglycan-binding domain-containing protein [Burkholderia sp. BE17]